MWYRRNDLSRQWSGSRSLKYYLGPWYNRYQQRSLARILCWCKCKTAMFIQQTFPVLEQEIAQGEGEYVAAMLNVRGWMRLHTQIL